jgi:hypothetical protein
MRPTLLQVRSITSIGIGGASMTAADFELLSDTEAERIIRWRFDELIRAGYESDDALEVAVRVDVDLHTAIGLLRRGCPAKTAVRILL